MTEPDTDAAPDLDFARRLQEFIAATVIGDGEGVELTTQTDLLLSGLVDSLGVVMIVEWIEADLDLTIDPGDVVLENFQTIDSIVGFVATA